MTDPQHRTDILKRLRDINDFTIANYYFNLVAELIRRHGIDSDDQRVSLNTRNESSKRRFSANINGRLVAGLRTTPDDNLLLLAVYEEDFDWLRSTLPGLEQNGEKFRDEEPRALLVKVSVKTMMKRDTAPLLTAWHRHTEAYLPRQQASQYRKHHMPLLYEMAADETVREKVFEEAADSTRTRVAVTKNSIGNSNPKTQAQQTLASLNTILYGPPGTGKTYSTIAKAVTIASPDFDLKNSSREETRVEYERLRALGQINFVTFHQSLAYEDFIEGIKPIVPDTEEEQMIYEVVPGIFRSVTLEAAFSFVSSQPEAGAAATALRFTDAYDILIDEIRLALDEEHGYSLPSRTGQVLNIDEISDRGNIRIRHGSSQKVYIVSKQRLAKLADAIPDVDALQNIDREVRKVIGGSNGTAYWSVLKQLQSMRNAVKAGTTQAQALLREYSYEEKAAAVRKIDWRSVQATKAKPYVLVIDEINRGNVSQIFGELITLIEDGKRAGQPEALSVTLPYSRETFSVPPNLYLIGTMNTADRSVEALDTALRRRFTFEEILPDETVIYPQRVGNVDLHALLKTINARLTALLDRDRTIGHAWLMGIIDLTGLQRAFKTKILPLLQEFFYNDLGKIGLVLGEAFVKSSRIEKGLFATFKGYDNAPLTGEARYSLADPETLSEADFINIYAGAQPFAEPSADADDES